MNLPAADDIRAFIAISLDPGLTTEFEKAQQRLGGQLPAKAVRWVGPEQVHLTLKFFGNVSGEHKDDLITAMNRACAGVGPFRLTLEGAGCFPDTIHPRIVWIGIGGDVKTLQELQKRVELETRDFGDHREDRIFRPHLTLGRVKIYGRAARQVGEVVERAVVPKLGDWPVREIHLMQSELSPHGARYLTLATAPLSD